MEVYFANYASSFTEDCLNALFGNAVIDVCFV